MNTDIKYMQMALELAARGLGDIEPNPAVGCVIVKDGEIIGSGYHERFGRPHAEANALANCKANGHGTAGATLYVTLEPCSHTGKTPPCSQAVIDAGVSKVVIAAEDPTDLAGGGIQMLKQAGIEVEVGVYREETEQLNAPFYKHAHTGLPWVVAKWAQSKDGYLAWKNPPAEGNWISNEQSRTDVHRLRKRMGAIITGVDTVIADNPKLTVRIPGQIIERPPLRVVLDSKLRIPLDCNLITVPDAPTAVVTSEQSVKTKLSEVEKLESSGVEVLTVPVHDDHCNLKETLKRFGKGGIQQVLIEAGPTLITEFLKQSLVDEAYIYIAPMNLGDNGIAPATETMDSLANQQNLKDIRTDTFGEDIRICGLL